MPPASDVDTVRALLFSRACASRSPILLAACTTPVAGTTGEDLPAVSDSVACAPASTVEGVDLSDGQGTVNWNSAYNDGIRFALVKATVAPNTQTLFDSNWSGMKSAGVIRGAYHFFDPTEDGVDQGEPLGRSSAFCGRAILRRRSTSSALTRTTVASVGQGGTGDASASAIRSRMMDFIDHGASGDGSHADHLHVRLLRQRRVDATSLQTYPLYIADPTTSNCFNVPTPWSAATMWQYSWTGSVSGISGDVDRDRFLGDITALEAFAGGSGSGSGSGGGRGYGSRL